ncbi:hypothetical protein [Streptomyces sp. GS7]|uniref:hypothetical protein n=1 Tax=Streptomyces sp. GS7 TaxID=2692234 RepID=UPI0013177683|nr:hypothetical protein [Streptomyces sp. GS7]QHC25260.1 hypothetical protein GR130_31690 [Streptomyces sp. GS7]
MPATLVAPRPAPVATPPVALAPVRRHNGRVCPVCAERRCQDAAECAAEYESRTWMACPDCDGTGYDTTEFQIWCLVCGGAKEIEGEYAVTLIAGLAEVAA